MNASTEPPPSGVQEAGESEGTVEVGQRLAQARDRQGLSRGDVARHLKLSVRQIEALERQEYDAFPSLVFVRGFLRNYAKVVELDIDREIAGIQPPAPVAPAEVVSAGAPEPEQTGAMRRSSKALAAAVLALVVGIFALVHQLGREEHAELSPQQGHVPLPELSAPPSGAGDNQVAHPSVESVPPAPADTSGTMAGTPRGGPTASDFALADPARTPGSADLSSAPSPVIEPSGSEIEPSPGATGRDAVAGSVEHELLSPANAMVADSEIKLQFDAEAWVEIKDHAGKVVFAQLNRPGSEQLVAGEGPLTLVVGNAQHVRVYYQGDPVDLGPHTRLDVARLVLQ